MEQTMLSNNAGSGRKHLYAYSIETKMLKACSWKGLRFPEKLKRACELTSSKVAVHHKNDRIVSCPFWKEEASTPVNELGP